MISLKSLMVLVLTVAAWAADPPAKPDPKKAMEEAIARQLASVAGMEASLEAQRASVAAQSQRNSAGGFFLLSPPAPSTAPPIAAATGDCERLPSSEMDALIESAAHQTDLQPELLRGIIKQESGFSPCAVSPKGAMGLMQLMPATASELGVRNPFDPKENVDAGARLFKQLLNMFDSVPLALGAYNAGPASVNQAGGIPNYPETQSFIRSILSGLPAKVLLPKH